MTAMGLQTKVIPVASNHARPVTKDYVAREGRNAYGDKLSASETRMHRANYVTVLTTIAMAPPMKVHLNPVKAV